VLPYFLRGGGFREHEGLWKHTKLKEITQTKRFSPVTMTQPFDYFPLTLLAHFRALHHGDEGNTCFEATSIPSATVACAQTAGETTQADHW